MTDIAQLNAGRRHNGQFGEREHSAPDLELDEVDLDDAENEVEPILEFEHDGHDYDIADEGDGTFSVHRASDGGAFVTNFNWAGDIEDHDELEDAATRALGG